MGFEPGGILEFGIGRRTGDRDGTARGTDDDIAVHGGEGLFLPVGTEGGDIDGIGIGGDTVNKILGRELIGIGIGIFRATGTAADTDSLWLDGL